ncbi:MAG: hypothetical protein AAF487_08125 [Bacteroidota bacterium]
MATKSFKYHISFNAKKANHIQFSFQLDVSDEEEICLSLPVWRPGRYEIANYAQYIKQFSVRDRQSNAIKYEKIGHSDWLVSCKKNTVIEVSYAFYSNRIDAGFSYADENQIYLNPVNCFFYVKNEDCSYQLNFKKKKSFALFSPLTSTGEFQLHSDSYDELFDSPTIFSSSAQRHSFKTGKYKINNVFQGVCEPNPEIIERDFKKFIDLQIESFGDLPVKEFSFLNQITSHRFYHGVEHKKNTVLAFGPGYLLDEKDGYENFLGLACHEFYHIWNVKHMRPDSLFPYDFSQENIHKIGWIIEGVTTYQGDVKLWQSEVFNDKTYFKLLAHQINRHLQNDGRYNQSVRESSVDLWLDGYGKGAPGKKVSIYTEGALVSFIFDILLLEKSKGEKSLDTVMKAIYQNFTKKGLPYSEKDFLKEIKNQGGNFVNRIFKNYIDKADSYEKELKKCLNKVGLVLLEKPISIERSYLGFHSAGSKYPSIHNVKENSPAQNAGLVEGMQVLMINNIEINKNLENWLTYFYGREINLTCVLNGKVSEHKIEYSKEVLEFKVSVRPKAKMSKEEKFLFTKWRKH